MKIVSLLLLTISSTSFADSSISDLIRDRFSKGSTPNIRGLLSKSFACGWIWPKGNNGDFVQFGVTRFAKNENPDGSVTVGFEIASNGAKFEKTIKLVGSELLSIEDFDQNSTPPYSHFVRHSSAFRQYVQELYIESSTRDDWHSPSSPTIPHSASARDFNCYTEVYIQCFPLVETK